MKKTILSTIATLITFVVSAQELPKPHPFSKDQYMEISRRQSTTGWILLGTGVALGTAGYFLFRDNYPVFSESNSGADAGAWMLIAGTASVLTSGGFFIASGVNKERAREMTWNIKMERGAPIVLQGSGPGYYPALSIKMKLR